MALKEVIELVKNRLPFVPSSGALDTKIEDFKLEQYYFLQPWTKIPDVDVETDSEYKGILRMLVAELVTYQLIIRKVIENMGGEDGELAEAGKHIKKGKADVVEAEFEYSKASDGNELLLKTEALLPELKLNICQYSCTLGYNLPMCGKTKSEPIPFLAFVKDINGNLT